MKRENDITSLRPRRAVTAHDIARIFKPPDVLLLVRAAAIPYTLERIQAIDDATEQLRLNYPQLFSPPQAKKACQFERMQYGFHD